MTQIAAVLLLGMLLGLVAARLLRLLDHRARLWLSPAPALAPTATGPGGVPRRGDAPPGRQGGAG